MRGPFGRVARPLLIALLAVVAAAVAVPASAVEHAAPFESRLQGALDAVVAAGAPGAVALVRVRGRTIRRASGHGDLKAKTALRVTDRFRVGSSTKTFVAAVVLQLVGERRLALDDTVERWLPGLVPGGSMITVRQLLNHTSGLYDYAEDRAFGSQISNLRKVWTPRQLVAIGTAHKPLFSPGARWSYSNTGYILLGLIVEQATGNRLGAELRKRVFAPLRLRATSFDTKPRIAGHHAHGYTRFDKERLVDISVVSPTLFGAAGAIVSTADDLARFYRTLIRGRLLRPDLLRAMKTTVAVTPQQRYGLGLIRSRYGPCGVFWGHGGETFGYESFADSSSDGARQVVIAINADGSVLRRRAQEAIGRLMEIAYCG